MPLRLGTRASALAQWQANWVADHLRVQGHEVELVFISTSGDATQGDASTAPATPVASMGGVGVFTKELQRALLDGRVDLAVHSLKDLPTDHIDGLALSAVLERASPFDVLIGRTGRTLDELPQGAIIGTGSLRRRAQLLHHRRDLRMADIRGNVDTRLRKLYEGQFDAIVLAEAGLKRLGLSDRVTQILRPDIMLPAVGQGALGIETRSGDSVAIAAVARLSHAATFREVLAERSFLAALAGGCLAPIGALALSDESKITLKAVVCSVDGQTRLADESHVAVAESQSLGTLVAKKLLAAGAARLIAAGRS